MISLGEEVRDKVTGYVGIACGRALYLSGQESIGVQAKMDQNGQISNLRWFDEKLLEVVGPGVQLLGAQAAPT